MSTLTTGKANAPISYDTFLSGIGERDRQNLSKHLAACEAEAGPDHARVWKRVICSIARLGPYSVQTSGQKFVRFFEADGAHYRRQVFALEDLRNGSILVYTADITEEAVRAGLLVGPVAEVDDGAMYRVRGEPSIRLTLQSLTAAGTTSAPDHYRHMLGWNRKAVRIHVPVAAADALIGTIETLCAMSVKSQNAPNGTGAGGQKEGC